jgi:hypothetical protein
VSQYLTADEFKKAPTGIDTSSLDQTNIGNQAAQDAALTIVLRQASSWVDNFCQVNSLEATLNTEHKEVRMGRDGRLNVHVDNTPIIELQSVKYQTFPTTGKLDIAVDQIIVYDNWFSIFNLPTLANALYGLNVQQPLPSTWYNTPYRRQLASDVPISLEYTYINGYMNSLLALDATAGDTTITLKDATGAYTGLKFTIYDGASEEYATVQSVSGNVVTLAAPLLFSHLSGVSVSALPASIKQATQLVASYLIKERGSLAITMSETVVQGTAMSYNKNSDLELAKDLLRPFVRRVVS